MGGKFRPKCINPRGRSVGAQTQGEQEEKHAPSPSYLTVVEYCSPRLSVWCAWVRGCVCARVRVCVARRPQQRLSPLI